jgi:hypothetical protein
MPSKSRSLISCLLAFLLVTMPPLASGELSTLFTTPQERQLINANRYKTAEDKQPVIDQPQQSQVQILAQEEVNVSYRISGVSLSTDGQYTVWINSRVYQDGETLDDGSRIKVMIGENLRVRVTAPDGKHYYGTSGDTLAVTYMAAAQN